MEEVKSFKIFFGDSTRRISLPSDYDEFVSKLIAIYSKKQPIKLSLSYKDEDGDNIVISSRVEWDEMLRLNANESTIKLYINILEGEITTPEIVNAYSESNDGVRTTEVIDNDSSSKVVNCLQCLFKDGKIIPFHLPHYLRDVIDCSNTNNDSVDIDINVDKLIDVLHDESSRLIENKEVSEAQKIVSALRILCPDDYDVLFKLACVESLLGNFDASLDAITTLFESGWNIQDIKSNPALEKTRNTVRFRELIGKYDTEKVQQDKSPVKEPEPEPEPEPEQEPEGDSEEVSPLEQVELSIIKWGDAIDHIRSMGFSMPSETIANLLDVYNGDINAVISELFEQ
eukprot:TRINITY_DN190_c1_g4_i1.p1 TRINITY_DN190_c1_g4~~TRINITY_DN190_c1_g4_i1.p1  ORF type:complete len:343 (-),score=78.94 TRINITY_DN190_c1_g4_i1:143-1171(-)